MNSGWIGVDLDGTLAEYHGWVGEHHIGDPIPVMLRRVLEWLGEGREVRIFTARICDGKESTLKTIQDWCLKHVGVALPVTNAKDFCMVECWDDRAIQVIPNTGLRADGFNLPMAPQ